VPGAADEFCIRVLTSQYARAEICDVNGLIVCSNPCDPPVPQIIPDSCPFDNDRPGGNQAPPLEYCFPEEVPPAGGATVTGRPANCEDTYPPAHEGYAENKGTWGRYTLETDGVCQSVHGKPTPQGCAHTVQLSTSSGIPYILCWYNDP
jgi:hypothetical protein